MYYWINEWGWVTFEELWRSRRVLSVEAVGDLHNSSYDMKAEFNIFLLFIQNNSLFKHAYLHRSIDVKYIFDSARLGLFSSANIFQIEDVALRVVFLLFLPCF